MDWASIPWNAVVWFVMSTIIIAFLEFKGDLLKNADPENYPKRRQAIIVFAYVVGGLNMVQIAAKIQLISFFNYMLTAALFFRFWQIEQGQKKKVARNMAFLTALLAVLSLMTEWQTEEAAGLLITQLMQLAQGWF